MGARNYDPHREVDSIRVEWSTSHTATGAAAKRKLQAYPDYFWRSLSAEQRAFALQVEVTHRAVFATIEEAKAHSAGIANSFIQVRYVGNKNHSFVGRDGQLFAFAQ